MTSSLCLPSVCVGGGGGASECVCTDKPCTVAQYHVHLQAVHGNYLYDNWMANSIMIMLTDTGPTACRW